MSAPTWSRRTAALTTELVDGQLVAYDLRDDQVHCLDATAALVWDACADADAEHIAATTGLTQRTVRAHLSALAQRNLIVSDAPALERRSFLKAAAVAAAVTSVGIWTIAAPLPAAAASGTGTGGGATGGGPIDPGTTAPPAITFSGTSVSVANRRCSGATSEAGWMINNPGPALGAATLTVTASNLSPDVCTDSVIVITLYEQGGCTSGLSAVTSHNLPAGPCSQLAGQTTFDLGGLPTGSPFGITIQLLGTYPTATTSGSVTLELSSGGAELARSCSTWSVDAVRTRTVSSPGSCA